MHRLLAGSGDLLGGLDWAWSCAGASCTHWRVLRITMHGEIAGMELVALVCTQAYKASL